MLLGTGITINDLIGLGIIGVFGVAVWLHARSHLMKYGTVTSELARLDNPGFGADVSGHGGCSDGASNGDCGDGGH